MLKCVNFPDADIKVMCSSDYIGIRVMEDFFSYHNVSLESLHLPNTSCRAQKTNINNVVYYTSRISKEEYSTCGGKALEVQHVHLKTKQNKTTYVVDSQSVSLLTEKLHSHHIFPGSAVGASGYWKHRQKPGDQAGL